MSLISHIGFSSSYRQMLLFTTFYFARKTRTPKSATGLFLALVGPNTFTPITAVLKCRLPPAPAQQDMVEMTNARRVEGIPTLDF